MNPPTTERASPPSQDGDITAMLHDWSRGRRTGEEELFALVYPHLRSIAGAVFAGSVRTTCFSRPAWSMSSFFGSSRSVACSLKTGSTFIALRLA